MSLIELCKAELRAIFTNPALLLTVLGGVLFYSVLYPLPYVSQVPREQQVVVADLDGSQLSRKLLRMVDATPQVNIIRQAGSINEAKQILMEQDLAGMLVIPENFYRDLLMGRQPAVSFAGDASYFLVFGTVMEGMTGAGQTLAAQVKVSRLLVDGQALPMAEQQYTPVKLRLHAMFNEAEGYVNYVIPAVFVLILHQTLIMGLGILAGSEKENLARQKSVGEEPYWLKVSPLALVCVRASIFVGIYLLLCCYYFGICLQIYDLPRLAEVGDIVMFGLVFLFATSFFGVALGSVLGRREQVTVIALVSSLPLVFSCGFIWPETAIPGWIVMLVQLVPAVPGIDGMVKLNQMGASIQQVLPNMQHLLLLGAVSLVLAVTLMSRRKRLALKEMNKTC
ncbi:ABC transporter permease [Desulfosediminicola ganghwensis]|uniref:ABC transporter permease n=1 Tax=Desulfosediminicola ganghwensis TaxID=2569540 RepID=UPI0010AD93E1|nr:ABC transporter permease [Desulfosediminicola ganghwensis]